jgi:DNA helicase-2/ATP-dependent DNA helicase PcrA
MSSEFNIILGPPGTGKTTKLLSLVEDYLERGVPPDRIGYFAFTRAAANEAMNRAMARFKLADKDLPYFKTLHSLAYGQIGITRQQMMTQEHYAEVSKWLKIGGFVPSPEPDQGPFLDFGYGDKFLELITMSRITCKPLREVYNYSTVPLKTDWARVDYVDRGLRHFKNTVGLYDYTDLLEQFVKRDLAPRLEVVFIDEAQDLSALQWLMVGQIAARAGVVYIAGDDDQAIYRWAGADVEHFINLEGNVEVLGQSYRIPVNHHKVSQKVVSRIPKRRDKMFLPREDEGGIFWHRHSEEVSLDQGEWLLMSRTRKGAQQLEEEVRQRGMLYNFNGSRSIDSEVLHAVRLWEAMRNGDRLRAADVRTIYKYMLLNTQVAYGYKAMQNVKEEQFFSIEDLMLYHGLLHTLPWDEGLGRIPEKDRRYLKACFAKGQRLDTTPRITISTIHAAKGREAENVLLTTDSSSQTSMWRKTMAADDDEVRVFYVGLTRAKSNLHLIHPMRTRGFNVPH